MRRRFFLVVAERSVLLPPVALQLHHPGCSTPPQLDAESSTCHLSAAPREEETSPLPPRQQMVLTPDEAS